MLAALARFPKLLERPVLVNGPRAALGRPAPEDALRIL
jgi:arsenate reductase-like glutaredoxin family protein